MTARIWPGALCYITHPTMFGRMVEALFVITRHDQGLEGRLLADNALGCWMCRAQGFTFTDKRLGPIQHAPIEDRWLRPLTPPPASDTTETDDTAPCEVDPAQPDRVSA